MASKLYGVNATIIIFVFVLFCIVHKLISPDMRALTQPKNAVKNSLLKFKRKNLGKVKNKIKKIKLN